jgi:hypothetical protein
MCLRQGNKVDCLVLAPPAKARKKTLAPFFNRKHTEPESVHEQKNGSLGSIYKDVPISPKLRILAQFPPLRTVAVHAEQGYRGYYS